MANGYALTGTDGGLFRRDVSLWAGVYPWSRHAADIFEFPTSRPNDRRAAVHGGKMAFPKIRATLG
jgi:hypothetical protein